ncbi:hypothetical protein JTB14_006018 [Gonioctena quinquepunctata]|nr:hypothetical protein JTB14_006018 [Gonioctena quinquepunctata]
MIAWMLRFYEISHKKTGRNVSELTFEEYEAAEIRLIRIVQSECFNKKGEYINMQIFQDEKGLLRVRTKLVCSEENDSFKFPILMPYKHEVVKSITKKPIRFDHLLTLLSFQSFKSLEDKLIKEDAADLVGDVALEIDAMMLSKQKGVLKIAEYAEFLSYHRSDVPIFENSSYHYFNSDNLTDIEANPGREQELFDEILTNECHWTCEQPKKSNLTNNMFASNDRRSKLFAPRKNEMTKECNCDLLPEKEQPPTQYLVLPLAFDPKFNCKVNLNLSIAKLALNVYQREQPVLEGLRWSEALDLVFKENLIDDPSLTWQYFASPKGFMRHYPAIQWSDEQYDETYDFRTRTWYTEAFTSPKDIIILLDRSGSTKGTRRTVAIQVVNQLLDTLNDNDFVNIYTFTNTTEPLVECFSDTLFQVSEIYQEKHNRMISELQNDVRILEEWCPRKSTGVPKQYSCLLNAEGILR